MIVTKVKAAFVVSQLEKISSEMGELVDYIYDDDDNHSISEQLAKITCDIMFDITGPIIKKYPSLRPPVMLGEKFKNLKYNIIKHDNISGRDIIQQTNLSGDIAEKIINDLYKNHSQADDCFFYLELLIQ